MRELFEEDSDGSLALEQHLDQMEKCEKLQYTIDNMDFKSYGDEVIELDDIEEVPPGGSFTGNAANLDC